MDQGRNSRTSPDSLRLACANASRHALSADLLAAKKTLGLYHALRAGSTRNGNEPSTLDFSTRLGQPAYSTLVEFDTGEARGRFLCFGFFLKGAQNLDLDQVLGAPGGALHPDQILQRRHRHAQAPGNLHLGRRAEQTVEARDARHKKGKGGDLPRPFDEPSFGGGGLPRITFPPPRGEGGLTLWSALARCREGRVHRAGSCRPVRGVPTRVEVADHDRELALAVVLAAAGVGARAADTLARGPRLTNSRRFLHWLLPRPYRRICSDGKL